MKLFVVLFAVIVAATAQTLTAEQTQKLKEHYKVCTSSSGASSDVVTKARGGEFADDPKLESFFTCMFKRIGLFDDAGNVQPAVFKAKAPAGVPAAQIDQLIQTCSKDSLPVEKRAMAAYKCYLTEAPVKIQLLPQA